MHAATDLIHSLARPEVRALPVYNAGLSSLAVCERYGVTDVARLGSNENPYGPSPKVTLALAELAASISVYPDANCLRLRDAIARQVGAQAHEVVVGNGSENLLELLCQAFLNPADRVLTVVPAFGLHEIYPSMMGARVSMVPMTAAYEFDVDALVAQLRSVGPELKMLMLSNPSNPVGCMLDAAAFARIVEAAPPNCLLVIDEAYYEYACMASGFPDALDLLRQQTKPWIVLRTFSKAWGLAGLRVGYGIASTSTLVQLLDRVRTPFNVNAAAQVAAVAALQDAPFMQANARTTVALREQMAAQLRAMGVTVAPSAANFLFLDLGRPSASVAEALLAHGVIVKPWKEARYTQCLRVSVGSAADNARFVAAFGEILGN